MQFSIRSLLAILLLCGILFPLVMGLGQVRRDEAMLRQLANEIDLHRQRLALNDPQRKLIKQHQQEEYASLRSLRDAAETHFVSVQEKYGKIEPRGPNVLSLRTVPQLSLDAAPSPVVFRLLVPKERQVWLKYAVIQRTNRNGTPEKHDQIDQPPIDTGFDHNGLYEVRLRPGERILAIQSGPVVANVLPIAMRLDEKDLLSTRFSDDGVPSTGSFHVSGRKQIDFEERRQLPWLLNVNVTIKSEGGSREEAPYAGCFWLSDRSSGFDAFPKQESSQ